MKKYHLAHHYKNFELGYGVTSEALLEYPLALLIWFFRQDMGLCLQHSSSRIDIELPIN